MLTTLSRIGLAHNASHGGTTGTASAAACLFHQHGLVRSTLGVAVRVAAVVASRSERHLGIVKLARPSVLKATSGRVRLALLSYDGQ